MELIDFIEDNLMNQNTIHLNRSLKSFLDRPWIYSQFKLLLENANTKKFYSCLSYNQMTIHEVARFNEYIHTIKEFNAISIVVFDSTKWMG